MKDFKAILLLTLLFLLVSNIYSQHSNINTVDYKYLSDLSNHFQFEDYDFHLGIPIRLKHDSLHSGKYFSSYGDSGVIKFFLDKDSNSIHYQIYDSIMIDNEKKYEFREGFIKKGSLVYGSIYINGLISSYSSYEYPAKKIETITYKENKNGELIPIKSEKVSRSTRKGLQIDTYNGGNDFFIKNCLGSGVCHVKKYYLGKLELEGCNKNQKKHNYWSYYYETGILQKKELWDNGVLKETKYYDEKGKLEKKE